MPSVNQLKDGETILVDKARVPPRILEASVQAVNKMASTPREKPVEKKPPTEKQLAARAKFVEAAKERASARRAMKVNPDELDEIPEDKVLVRAVAGRRQGKRPGRPPGSVKKATPSESETEVVEAVSAPPVKPVPRNLKPKPIVAPPPPSETEEEPAPKKRAPPKTPKASAPRARPARKPKSYYSETSETEAQESSESEDEHQVKERVRKYAEKTKTRLEALRQIEQQLKPQSKYTGMSIF